MKPQHLIHFIAACLIACLGSGTAHAGAPPKYFERALWVWDAGVIVEAGPQSTLMAFCKQHDIALLYVSTARVFGEAGQAKKPPISRAQLGAFVRRAHAQGIKVHGLDGDPGFARRDKHALALARLERALDYNAMAPPEERLDGWQWDTEPYLLPDFKTPAGRRQILVEFLDSAQQMRDAIEKHDAVQPPVAHSFALGYAIPFWLDNRENAVSWNGADKAATFHLMDILNALPASYIAIMAYRDRAEGPNGSIALTEGEARYATQKAPRVRVWIGQETLDVKGDPPSITFWQEGASELEKAIAQIGSHYAATPAVAGVAIHHWESYRLLTER